MEKYIKNWNWVIFVMLTFVSCVKTEPLSLEESYTQKLTEEAQKKADIERIDQEKADQENNKAWEAYYQMLREYKQQAWKGEKPFCYFFYSGWAAVEGIDKTWLQAMPDSLTAVSIWGGFGKEPEELTENQKYDLEMFHKKGGTVFTCYQVSNVGLGLPGGLDIFSKKYGRGTSSDEERKRVQIYARDLARHIIALNFDGFDIDWEPTVGDHKRSGYAEFVASGSSTNGYHTNMITFIKELGKYFGAKYTGDQRKQYLRELFDENNQEYHPEEKDYINKYKPYFEKYNAVDKKFYLLFDGEFFQMTQEMDSYFDKYIMQDYGRSDSFQTYLNQQTKSGSPSYYPSNTKAASTAEFEKGHYTSIIQKAKNYKTKNGGVSAYKGEFDIATTFEDIGFVNYLQNNNIKGRKYTRFAWVREAMRIMDPRSEEDYKGFKEEFVIRLPKK